jgi:hypothetical protein
MSPALQRKPLPHPAILLDDSPQLRKVIEELEAGTYPQPDVAVWRDDLPRYLAWRLARATGATDDQILPIANERPMSSLACCTSAIGRPCAHERIGYAAAACVVWPACSCPAAGHCPARPR